MMVGDSDDLLRLESAASATASGDLAWERWPLDVVIALGLSGRRNPLGFAVVRYLSEEPSSARVWDVHLHLVTELIRRGAEKGASSKVAQDAIVFWNDMRCRTCEGRGVVKGDLRCSACGGTKRRSIPDGPELLCTAVSCLIEAEQWMERQLRARLKGANYAATSSDGYKLNLGQQSGNSVGAGGQVATPKAPNHE